MSGTLSCQRDVENISEASVMEVLKLFFISSICGPGFRAIE